MLRSVIFSLLLAVSTGLAEDAPATRELRCRVVDEAGLDRGTPSPDEITDSSDFHPGWVFQTDRQGAFTVRFGKFNPYQHENIGAYAGPGDGIFQFVVAKPGWAGGVSRMIVNLENLAAFEPPSTRKPSGDELDTEEWRRGKFAPLVLGDQPPSKPLEIVLKRGLEVRGRMVDPRGQPVPSQEVSLYQDLHYGSHTSAGGEIFEQTTRTDRNGHFHFRHVYPNTFRISPVWSAQPLFWIATRVRRCWRDRIVDYVTPRYERSIALELVVTPRSPYRYFGRITDAEGHTVPALRVAVGVSWHEPAQTYGDEHHYQETQKDEQGNYSVTADTRFANGVWVNTDTTIGGVNAHGDKLLSPGRYDFAVRPKKAGE